MRPDNKHPYAIEDEVRVRAPVEAVMGTLLDPTTWPKWQSEIHAVSGPERIEPGDEVAGDARVIGFHLEGVSRVVDADGGMLVEDVIVGVRMRVSYQVDHDNGETVIRRRLETRLPGGPLGGIFTLVLKRKLKRMQKELLRDLAAQASEAST